MSTKLPMTMKALRFASTGQMADVLHLEDVPVPQIDDNSVLVHVKASAINPSDCKNIAGAFPQTTLPRTPGRDFAGIVVDGPSDLVGKKVWGTGGDYGYTRDGMHAEYVVIPSGSVEEMPKNLTFAQAAACGVPYLTASLMSQRSGAREGEYVIVLGSSGSVGSAAVGLLRQKGINVVESSRSASTPGVLNLADAFESQLASITNGKSVIAVIDTVSDPAVFQKALKALGPKGTYVIITAPRDHSPLAFNALDLYRGENTITGVNSNRVSFRDAVKLFGEMRGAFEPGLLSPPRNIQEVPMTSGQDAIEAYIQSDKGAKGKKVLVN